MRSPTMTLPFPSLGYTEPVELVALGDTAYARVSDASAMARAILGHGIPAAQRGETVFATEAFAAGWTKRLRRYKTTPKRGQRLEQLIADVAGDMKEGAAR